MIGRSLSTRIAADPYYRFQSIAELQAAVTLGIRIDVNKAGIDDWLRLPGLSIHQARLLVELTQSGVLLYSLDDLAAILNLPRHRLEPLAPILQFCYYDPVATPTTINPNQANLAALMTLPQMTPAQAQGIIRERVSHGPYRHLADFQQRLQLSPQTIQNWLNELRF